MSSCAAHYHNGRDLFLMGINMKIHLLALIILVLSPMAFAQLLNNTAHEAPKVTAGISGQGQVRYFGLGETKRVDQYNLTLTGFVDINGVFTLHSMVQTGGSGNYNVGFYNIYNNKNQSFNTQYKLYLKRLYLEGNFFGNAVNVQAGSMGTRSSIANTNKLSNIGWIDGARAEVKTKTGNVLVTIGQIKSTEANMLERYKDTQLNYVEISINTKLMDGLLAEAGVEVFDGKTFIQAATNYDLEVATGRVLKFVADGKVQADNGAFKIGAGIKDVISLLKGKKSAVKLSVNYEYVHRDFSSNMNGLANGIHSGYTGGAVVMKTSYPISKKYGVTGFTNIKVGNSMANSRFAVGIKKSLFNKKMKRR